jgi:hypothetical protein
MVIDSAMMTRKNTIPPTIMIAIGAALLRVPTPAAPATKKSKKKPM